MPYSLGLKKYRFLSIASLSFLLFGSIAGILVPAGSGWDFANFYDTGRRLAAGQVEDLYRPDSAIAGEKPRGSLAFYGTPLSAYLYVPLSFFSPENALIVFKIQNTLAYFAALIFLYLHYRKFAGEDSIEQSQFAALFVFVSLIYQPFWTVYRIGGQSTPTVFLLLTLALLCHTHSRFLLSAFLLVVAVLIKPILVTALLFLLIVSPFPFLAYTLILLAASGLFSILLMGWTIHLEFLRQMLMGLRNVYPWFYNSSLYVPFDNLKALAKPEISSNLRWLITILQTGLKITAVLTTAVLTLKSRSQMWSTKASLHFRFVMSVVFFLLFSQTVWEHYLSFLFLLLAYMIAFRRYFCRSTHLMLAMIFILCLGQSLIVVTFLREHFLFDSIPELLLIGFFKSAPLFLTLVLLLARFREFYQSYTAKEWSK